MSTTPDTNDRPTDETMKTDADAPASPEGADSKDWSEQLKKFVFAAVGAVHLSPEDVRSFVKRLVEKGELAKKDGEKILKQFAERVQQTVKRDGKTPAETVTEAAEKAAAALNQEKLAERIHVSIERVLHTMNIATRKDVEDLGKQLDELDRKVEQLVEAAAGTRTRTRAATAPSSTAS